MPYSISTEAEDCNGFAVVKDDDNFIMGCHETEEKAKDQITALNIAEAESKRQAQGGARHDTLVFSDQKNSSWLIVVSNLHSFSMFRETHLYP